MKYTDINGNVVEVVTSIGLSIQGSVTECTVFIDTNAEYHVLTSADFDKLFTVSEPKPEVFEYQILAIKKGIASIVKDTWATEAEVAELNSLVSGVLYSIIPETKQPRV